ncbi:hypothetical protein AB3S75_015795 [Citrus x aurantiifolia]
MSVKDGGIPIQLGGPSENIAELRDIFQSTVKWINIKTLEDIIKQEDKTSWIFKVVFTLFALATLLCPTSGYISHLFLHPCNDVLNVKSLNWASFCYKWLAKSIGKYKNRETSYVGGCLLFLQIFYLHNVAYNCIQPDGTKTPMTFWKKSMVKRWLRSQGGIGSNKIQMRTTDTGEASQSKAVRHLNFEEIIQKQILSIRVLTFKVDYLFDAISDQAKMLKELLRQRQIMDRVAHHVHHPTTDNIKTHSHKFVSAQENNVGAKFIEILSNESSAQGYDKINSPYDGSSLNTKERQLYQILRTLEMAIDCEKTDVLPSKKMEMSKGKQELILKDSKEGLVMIQSTAKGMHIQISKEKNVNFKSTQPRFLAGPFSVPTPFTEDEKKLILYLFGDKLDEMDVVIRTEYNSIAQSSMRSLLPRAWIDGDIITMYAEYKTIEEAQKDITSPRCWFLPSYYSQVVLGDSGDLNPYCRASRFQERYMPQLETYEKIYVPIHCEAHWYMLVIDILRQTANIWDSLESLSQREKMINQSLTIHDSDYARILLALYLEQSPLNDIRHKLMQDASNGYGKCSAADLQRAPCKQTSELRKAARNINLN